VWDSRRALFKISLTALALALCIAYLLPKEYQATVVLAPPDSSNTSRLAAMVQMVAGPDSGIAADLFGKKDSGDLLIEMLRSRALRGRIVDRFDLRRLYSAPLMTDARDKLSRHTALSQDKKSGVIIITVTDHDPHRVKSIADSYVEELNHMAAQSNTSAAHRERVFVEGRLATVTQELQAAEKDFSEFASKNVAIDVPQQGKAMVEATAVLEGQLIAAESELSGLEQIYSAQNVRVRSLRARISALQEQLNKFGGPNDAADSNQGGSSSSMFPSIRQLPLLGVPYADLFRRVKVEEAVFETLTKQYELAKIEEAKELPSIRVLDPAEVPERKSWPPRLVLAAATALIVFLATVAVIVSMAWWRELDPADPRKTGISSTYQQAASSWRQFRARLRSRRNGHGHD
jgi:uncharacterized protein involved in exopolysaccharide biosynthesis